MEQKVERGNGMHGRVFQINTSDGGVPKLARLQTAVTEQGVEGDRQRNLRVHGGPERAVCIFSVERILDLQAEGHPIFPGAIGENLTLSGLDWAQVAPGTRFYIGSSVVLEVTRYTVPCDNLRLYFIGEDFSRVSQNRHPGWSRVYTRVLQPGIIRTGDPVRVVL